MSLVKRVNSIRVDARNTQNYFAYIDFLLLLAIIYVCALPVFVMAGFDNEI